MRIDMKRMQLKTFGFVMMLGLMIGAKSQAQLAMSFKSASQQLIEDAVKEGVLLYRQDYLLEDSSGSRFTLDNQACVGKASGFCVLLDDGYVVPRSLLEPWKGDDVYEPYAGQYKAVVSASWRRSVEDARWVEAGILQARDKADLLSGTWCQAQDSLFRGKGFAIDAEPGRKEGWLVWLAADMATALDSAKLDMFIYRHALDIKPDADTCLVPALKAKQKVLGGVYLNPVFTGVGKVEFHLVGPVVQAGEQWVLLPLASFQTEPTKPAVLTPVKDDEGTAEEPASGSSTGSKKKKDRKSKE